MNALDSLARRYLVEGDETAMEELVRRTRPRLLAAARRIAGASEAEDCVQTAYVSLVHKRGAELAAPALPWLLTAVVRTAYRRRAQAQRQVEIANRLRWAHQPESPAQAAGRREEAARLRDAIDQLPSGLRDVVVLHYLEGLPTCDVAGLIGIREPAVRKRLQRARALLRVSRVTGAFLSLFWWMGDATAALPGVGGMLVQKTAVVAVASALVLVLVGFWAAQPGSSPERAAHRDAREEAATPPGPRERVPRQEGRPATGEEPPPPSPDPTHTGTVYGIDGEAVADATVTWFSKEGRGNGRTGTDGAYRLVAHDARWLRIRAPGYAPLIVRADASRDAYLTKGARLEGRVTGDVSVAGLRVLLWSVEARAIFEDEAGRRALSPWSPCPLAETVTDAGGRFVFEHVPADGFHEVESGMAGPEGQLVGYVRAAGPGVVTAGAGVPVRPAGSTIRVAMPAWASGAVAGRVVDGEGRGIPGLRVHGAVRGRRLVRWPRPPLYPTIARPDVLTDSEGRYRLDGLPAGELSLWVRRPGLRASGPRLESSARVNAGSVETLPDLVWSPPDHPLVDVTVLDERGRPVPDALVSLVRFGAAAPSDAQGRARLHAWAERLWDKPAEVRVLKPGYVRQRVTGIRLGVGRPVTLTVSLPRGHALRGTVVWNDGTPATGASVTISDGGRPFGEAPAPLPRSAGAGSPGMEPGAQDGARQAALGAYGNRFVDADGAFEFRDIAAGPYHVRAHHKGVWSEVVTVDGDGPVRVEFNAPPPSATTGTIEGTIVDDATGDPILRAPLWLDGKGRRVGTMTAPGRFRIDEIPPGTWKLRVPMQGYLQYERVGLEVDAGDTLHLEVRLARGAIARGQVTGAGVGAGVSVWFLRTDGWFRPASPLDAEGRYELAGLLPGRYRVYVMASEPNTPFATASPLVATVGPQAREIVQDIAVAPGAAVSCLSEGREATAGSRIELRDADGRVWLSVQGTGARNGATCPVPPGHYEVRWFEGEKTVARESVVVAIGGRATLTLSGDAR